MKKEHRRILTQMSYSAFSRYVSLGLLTLRGFVLAHLLGPASFGTWNSMRLVFELCDYSHFGAQPGMLQCATLASGARNPLDALILQRTGYTLSLAGALLAALVLAVSAWFVSIDRALWLCLPLLVVIRCTWHYSQAVVNSQRRYALSSTLSIVIAAISTCLGSIGAYYSGLAGFLGAFGIAYLVAFLVAAPYGGFLPKPVFDRRAAGLLLRTGFPIMLSNLLKLLLWNVDKILVWGLLGKLALGLYALQATITNAVMLIPAGVVDVFYPHLLHELGRKRSLDNAREYLLLGTDMLSRALCPVLAVSYLTLHIPIHWLLPDYAATVPPGLVLILAAFFPIAGAVAGTVQTALDGRVEMLVGTAVAVAVAGAAVWLAIALDAGFVGIACGTGAGLLVRAASSIVFSARRCALPRADFMRILRRLLVSFVLLLASVGLPSRFLPSAPDSFLWDCFFTALQCMLALALLAPWVAGAWRNYQLRYRPARADPDLIAPDSAGG